MQLWVLASQVPKTRQAAGPAEIIMLDIPKNDVWLSLQTEPQGQAAKIGMQISTCQLPALEMSCSLAVCLVPGSVCL